MITTGSFQSEVIYDRPSHAHTMRRGKSCKFVLLGNAVSCFQLWTQGARQCTLLVVLSCAPRGVNDMSG